MIVSKFDKTTGKVTIQITSILANDEIDFLKICKTRSDNDGIPLSFHDLLDGNDRGFYNSYFSLKQLGFVNAEYDAVSTNHNIVLTDTGKCILDLILKS